MVLIVYFVPFDMLNGCATKYIISTLNFWIINNI